jgi:cell division protein FtsW
MLEPDLGTTIVIAGIAFTLFYLAQAPIKQIAVIILSGLLIGSMLILVSPYRRDRLTTFLDPTSDPLGSSYHIRQVLISLGSGGIFGTGFGRSRQKFQFLPEATTDSIFAVIAEETGFIGASIVILIYFMFIYRAFKIVKNIDRPYPQLVASGVLTWFSLQTALNLAAMTSLIPLTGVPLPFISYGGSSLITLMTAVGLLLNSSRYRKIDPS